MAALTRGSCDLPELGWGHLTFADSSPAPGRAYTDDGQVHEHRGLKGRTRGRPATRARKPTRRVPVPPELVVMLREHIDLPVLMSHFCDFEDLLLNDGCTGVAVISTTEPMEVQFDEHKLLVVYAGDLRPFELLLDEQGIARTDRLRLITEGEHMHSTDPRYRKQFEQLCYRLGVGKAIQRVSW